MSRHPVYISIWDVAPVVEGFRSRSSLYPNPPRPLARSFWSWRRQYRQHMIRATIHKARTPKNTPTIKIVLSLPSWFTIKLSLTSVNPAWIEKLKSLALKSTRGWFTCVNVSTFLMTSLGGFGNDTYLKWLQRSEIEVNGSERSCPVANRLPLNLESPRAHANKALLFSHLL